MNPLNHVAIIMDGNGRWGLRKKKDRNFGHKEGLKTTENIISECIRNKIKYLTLFAFSTENWKRPKKEINFLFNLLEKFLIKNIKIFNKKNIRLKIIGEKTFSKKLNQLLTFAENETKNNNALIICLALNYGSKQEIISTVKFLIKKKIKINIKNVTSNLYSKNIPDPDLLIRTGNTKRLSNFLLWQISYTEIFFLKKLWPDFNKKDFKKIILEFYSIKRNFGSV